MNVKNKDVNSQASKGIYDKMLIVILYLIIKSVN